MTKTALSDDQVPLTFRAYFWSYSVEELTEVLAMEFGAKIETISETESKLAVGSSEWLIIGASPTCVLGSLQESDSLDEAEVLSEIQMLSRPWRVEWLSGTGAIVREYDSEKAPGN